jgi:hypothetical protein
VFILYFGLSGYQPSSGPATTPVSLNNEGPLA